MWVFLEFAIAYDHFSEVTYTALGKKTHKFENGSSFEVFEEAHIFMNLKAINLI